MENQPRLVRTTTRPPKPALLRRLRGRGTSLTRSQTKVPNDFILRRAPSRDRRMARSRRSGSLGRRSSSADAAAVWPELRPGDPLNVAQNVTRYLSKTSRSAVVSVHDLASVIATCCVDAFDPSTTPEAYLFFDIFEQSLVKVARLCPSC
jgi:hypothetical protein